MIRVTARRSVSAMLAKQRTHSAGRVGWSNIGAPMGTRQSTFEGTQPVRERHQIDEHRLGAAMAERFDHREDAHQRFVCTQ